MRFPKLRMDDVTRGAALLALLAFVATALSGAGVFASLLTAMSAAFSCYGAWRTHTKPPKVDSVKPRPVRVPAARLESYLSDASETMRALRSETESECEAAVSALSEWRLAQRHVREARSLRDAVAAASDAARQLASRLLQQLASAEGASSSLAKDLGEVRSPTRDKNDAFALQRELSSSLASLTVAADELARLEEPITGFGALAEKVGAINADLQLLAVNATLLASRKIDGHEVERLGESARDLALRLDALAHAAADLVSYVQGCESEARVGLAQCKESLEQAQLAATPFIQTLQASRKADEALSAKIAQLKGASRALSASLIETRQIASELVEATSRWADEDLALGRAIHLVDRLLATQAAPVDGVERVMRRQLATLGQFAERLDRLEQDLLKEAAPEEPSAPEALPNAVPEGVEDDEFERLLVGAIDRLLVEPEGPTLDLSAVTVTEDEPELTLPVEREAAS